MSRRRKLSHDEQVLWEQVAKSATPLHRTQLPAPLRREGPDGDRSDPATRFAPTQSGPQEFPGQGYDPAPGHWLQPRVEHVPDRQPAEAMRMASVALGPRHVGARARASRADDLSRPMAEALHSAPVVMDRKAFARMRRGKLEPDARIDLHGMTLAQAQSALRSFVPGAVARGHRLVLVITGKGRGGDHGDGVSHRRGALRHEVPHWLRRAPLAPLVLEIRPAHQRHGGEGAYYVYLRRPR